MTGSFARGREFEVEVAGFLTAAGFDVTTNAKSAKPRQTDLFAKSQDVDLLIEAKNQMAAQPSMIKRPVLNVDGKLFVGFKPKQYENAFGAKR
jgi:arsenate reductase (glutaredoxin)